MKKRLNKYKPSVDPKVLKEALNDKITQIIDAPVDDYIFRS